MTPEQKQLEQIRAGAERLRFERDKEHLLASTDVERAYENTISDLLKDVDFLLSLVKSQEAPPALLVQPQIIRSDADVRQLFDAWWRVNHPFSWWAEERGGQPLPEPDRQMVRDLSERAFYAAEVLGLNAATSMRSACVEKVRELQDQWAANRTTFGASNDRAHIKYGTMVDASRDIIIALESLSIEKLKE